MIWRAVCSSSKRSSALTSPFTITASTPSALICATVASAICRAYSGAMKHSGSDCSSTGAVASEPERDSPMCTSLTSATLKRWRPGGGVSVVTTPGLVSDGGWMAPAVTRRYA